MVEKKISELTDAEIQTAMIIEYKAKKIEEENRIKQQAFYTARDLAFSDLNSLHELEKNELATIWQAKEDNGYVI